jgi:hypothetical protein
VNIPFVQNLSEFDLFTIPSIYQLLPHQDAVHAFDENLQPIKVDIYSPTVWEENSWTPYSDKRFADEFNVAGQKNARTYFRAVLLRAKLLQLALNADSGGKPRVPIYYLGAECKDTLDGMIIYKAPGQKVPKTIFSAGDYLKTVGKKYSKAQLESILNVPGDGVVTKSSLIYSLVDNAQLTIACGDHNRLTGLAEISQSIISVLNNSVIKSDENTDKSVKAKEFQFQ